MEPPTGRASKTAMSQTHEFALVIRSPNAIEKADSGAKRVLAGMAADVVAMATVVDKELISRALQSRALNYFFGLEGVVWDHGEAVRLFREAAIMGNANAQTCLGICYAEGEGVAKDLEQAVHWYRVAAEQGAIGAQSSLGHLLFLHEEEGKRNYVQAIHWLRKAAEQEDQDAENDLGVCYQHGYGVAQDFEQAAHWYRKAAGRGNATAQTNLGDCYQLGRGVAVDCKEAVQWYRRAAENRIHYKGDPTAQFNLGVCYLYGAGVLKDAVQAYKWFKLAAKQDYSEATKKLASLTASISAAELADGERAYEECSKRNES